MSKDLNQCNFTGRLGKDPELKYLASGSAVVNFSLACGDDYKDKTGQKVEQTEWINMSAFGKLAEIIGQYTHKGSKIFISGKFKTRKWQGADGSDRYSTEIVVKDMIMLDSLGQSQQHDATQQSQAQPEPDDFSDEIPF